MKTVPIGLMTINGQIIMSKHSTNLKDISVGIKTFYRTEKLQLTLSALLGKNFAEVIVADDGKISKEKDDLYNDYSKLLPLKVIKLPFDTGLSYGRNRIVECCNTPYLLMLDDDQVIPENIHLLKDVLESNEELGGVSCFSYEYERFVCRAYNLFLLDGYVIKDIGDNVKAKQIEKSTYYICDFIPNSTLFRINCFDEIQWDENIKIGKEHIDFYLNHKLNSNWKFAVTPDVVIRHYPSTGTGHYESYRHKKTRIEDSQKYLLNKWGIKKVLNGLSLYTSGSVGKRSKIFHKLVNKQNPVNKLIVSMLALFE